MRKRIALWLTALLLSASIFSGCTDEDIRLAGQLLELVLGTEETTQPQTETRENWAEDGTDSGAISNIGDLVPGEAETEVQTQKETSPASQTQACLSEDGTYTSQEDVALYIATYGHLPSNYITKDQAQALGWSSKEGNLWEVAPGMCIGGDRFGNYEGVLPEKKGRRYTECDVNYQGGYRSSERIVFSNDGLVYYTEDHYETFTLLYGEE